MLLKQNPIVVIIAFISLVSCSRGAGEIPIPVNPPPQTEMVAQRVLSEQPYILSLYSLLQANGGGLVITPAEGVKQSALLSVPAAEEGECCRYMRPLIEQGRGPHEMVRVSGSTKTPGGDSLIFYSAADGKYLLFDDRLKPVMEWTDPSLARYNSGTFAYNRGYMLMAVDPALANGKLIRIVRRDSDNELWVFDARVPVGFQPAIRNRIFAAAALPSGFAIAFTGDKRIYVLDYHGTVTEEVVLGKSDPIGEPYRINNPMMAASAKPYIPKMEFHSDHLWVLMEREIWILTYPDFRPLRRLRILARAEQRQPTVTDFSISGQVLYLRMGRNDIYELPVNPRWLE